MHLPNATFAMAESLSPHALESVVAALPAEEARKRLLDLLIQFPEKGRELLLEKGRIPEDEKAEAGNRCASLEPVSEEEITLERLRTLLDGQLTGLIFSLENDEFTPDWEEDELTNEWDFIGEMQLLFEKAARTLPLDHLVALARETNENMLKRTVFPWHPYPPDGLEDFLEGIGIGRVAAAPQEEKDAALEEVRTHFAKVVDDSALCALMRTIEDLAKCPLDPDEL